MHTSLVCGQALKPTFEKIATPLKLWWEKNSNLGLVKFEFTISVASIVLVRSAGVLCGSDDDIQEAVVCVRKFLVRLQGPRASHLAVISGHRGSEWFIDCKMSDFLCVGDIISLYCEETEGFVFSWQIRYFTVFIHDFPNVQWLQLTGAVGSGGSMLGPGGIGPPNPAHPQYFSGYWTQ